MSLRMKPFSFTVRFVESGNDEQIITTDERKCVRKEFRGNGFRLKGTLYSKMFVSKSNMLFVASRGIWP